jgi:hypothetical protein
MLIVHLYHLSMFIIHPAAVKIDSAPNMTQIPGATSLEGKISVFRYGLLMRNRGCIEFETLQCWPYLRNIKTAINYFLETFCT